MPRARINEEGEDVVLPKTRARKPRAVSVDSVVAPAPRRRAASRSRVAPVASEPALRKAPTPLAYRRKTRSRNSRAFFVVLGACLLLSGAGIGIGFMDRGSIDVIAVVNERNEKINKGEVRDATGNAVTQTIQVQTDSRPNGGLPMGDAVDTPVPPVPLVSTSTEATTTSEIATSTESEIEETEASPEPTE